MTKNRLNSWKRLEKNWKNAAGIAAIATSAIFIRVGRNAPVIWRSVATCSRLNYMIISQACRLSCTLPPWSLSNLNYLKMA